MAATSAALKPHKRERNTSEEEWRRVWRLRENGKGEPYDVRKRNDTVRLMEREATPER